MNDWVKAEVIKFKKWSNNIFSIFLNAKIKPFIAGQFAKILIILNKKKIIRAYSYVNSPENKILEFYIIIIKHGIMSNYLSKLNIKDKIMIKKNSFGYFTIKNIPKCKDLWMLSTGTGIGPYLSILSKKKKIKKFKKIILIHSIKYLKNLHYLHIIKKIKKIYKKKIIIKITLTREKKKNFLHGRLTKLLKNGTLEKKINKKINNKKSHIMLCGNPNMIKNICEILKKKKKMYKKSKNKKGNITTESYW